MGDGSSSSIISISIALLLLLLLRAGSLIAWSSALSYHLVLS
jgi:hypothetical protein